MGGIFSSYAFYERGHGRSAEEAFNSLLASLDYHYQHYQIDGDFNDLEILILPYGFYRVHITCKAKAFEASMEWNRYTDEPRRYDFLNRPMFRIVD